MRVRVIGDSESAVAVRSSLHLAGVVVSDAGYGYTVEVNDTGGSTPTIDSVDSEFERRFINCIAIAADTPIMLLRPGGVQSDRHVAVGVPVGPERHLIEKGIMRAVVQMMVPVDRPIQAALPSPVVGHQTAVRSHTFWERLIYLLTGHL